MPIKAVFFDIDGTLVDSNEFHVMAWDEAFRDNGRVTEKDAIRGQIGKGADQLIPALFPNTDQVDQDKIADRHGEIFRARYLHQVKPFPHATDLIELLHSKGKNIVLASSAENAEVKFYIGLLNIASVLMSTISTDDVSRSKPSGDIFAAALAQVFPLAASETIAICDTPYDVESALQSNIKTIALRSGGFSEEALGDAGAEHIYGSVKELFENFDASLLGK
jgi:beta-phosphoglucomutase-like phosphatase (HAD superfamily)